MHIHRFGRQVVGDCDGLTYYKRGLGNVFRNRNCIAITLDIFADLWAEGVKFIVAEEKFTTMESFKEYGLPFQERNRETQLGLDLRHWRDIQCLNKEHRNEDKQ